MTTLQLQTHLARMHVAPDLPRLPEQARALLVGSVQYGLIGLAMFGISAVGGLAVGLVAGLIG